MESQIKPRECRVIVDFANVMGSMEKKESDLSKKCSVTGFRNLFQLFDFTLTEIHVVAPTMLLKHFAFAESTPLATEMVKNTRDTLDQWSREAKTLGIEMPIAPPGGLWHGEIGVDAIVAMLAIFYASCDVSRETIIFSTDADLQGLRMHDEKKPSPLVFGFFDNDHCNELKNNKKQRFVSVLNLENVLAGGDPYWTPQQKDNEWCRSGYRISEMQPQVASTTLHPVSTSCLVDSYGLLQVGTRQLGIGHEPNVDTVSSLLTSLGFHNSQSQRWIVPDIVFTLEVEKKLKKLWERTNERYNSLSSDILNDNDPRTIVNRSIQRVSSGFADRIIYKYGKERLLNHRWMKQLTTGLISDLWAAIHEKRLGSEHEVVLLAGNLDLEHCLQMCSAYGPEELRKMLHQVYRVFGEPPGLSENSGQSGSQKIPDSFETWVSKKPRQTSYPRGSLKFVTLTDRQLARLLGIRDGMYGRQLRAKLVGTTDSNNAVDPDTAIAKIQADPKPIYKPKYVAAATGVKINGTEVELIGFKDPKSDSPDNRNWASWYADRDESLAPLLLQDGIEAPWRSRITGEPVMAKVVNRYGRNLKVQLWNNVSEKYEKHYTNIAVDDMPYRFSPDDVVNLGRLHPLEPRWIVVDIPKFQDVDEPEPVIVCVDEIISVDPQKFKVSQCDDKSVKGELLLRSTPFDSAEISVGDRVLALEIFIDLTDSSNPKRNFLGLSSPLPWRNPTNEPPRDQTNPIKPNVVVHHWEVVDL